MPGSKKRLHEWSPSARRAYLRTLDHIASDDVHTATLVAERVAHSLELIETNPGMGTLVQGGRVRCYPVPRTGHAFNYRETEEGIKIVRWYRSDTCESIWVSDVVFCLSRFAMHPHSG